MVVCCEPAIFFIEYSGFFIVITKLFYPFPHSGGLTCAILLLDCSIGGSLACCTVRLDSLSVGKAISVQYSYFISPRNLIMLEYNREDHWAREENGNYPNFVERFLKEKLQFDSQQDEIEPENKENGPT